MAMFEGPSTGGEQFVGPPPSPAAPAQPEAAVGQTEVPKISTERVQQELNRLAVLIEENETLRFLEPRIKKCQASGEPDLIALLSFYRLVSQSLAEEMDNQRIKFKELENELHRTKNSSLQTQLEEAFSEASQVVQQKTQSAPASQASGPMVSSEESEAFREKLEASEKQVERLMVDMQNMRNRSKTDVEVKVFQAVEKFTQSLLPALDAFHQAMPSLKTAQDQAAVVTGVEMIYEQLQDCLFKAGLKKMKVVGQPFDPRLHEAIGDVPTDEMPDDHIYDELQPGYLFGERLIRAAMVRVARNVSPSPSIPTPAAPAPAPVAPPPAPAAAAPAPAPAAPPPAPAAAAPAPAPAAPPPAPAAAAPAPAPAAPPPAPAAAAPAPAPAAPPPAPAAAAPEGQASAPAQATQGIPESNISPPESEQNL